jgi:hypothetical protein
LIKDLNIQQTPASLLMRRRKAEDVRGSFRNDDEMVLPEAAVWLSPFKVPRTTIGAEVILPSPIPFVNYQELEPVAVILLLMKMKKDTPIAFVNYQELEPVAGILLLMKTATIALKRASRTNWLVSAHNAWWWHPPYYSMVAAQSGAITEDERVLRAVGFLLSGGLYECVISNNVTWIYIIYPYSKTYAPCHRPKAVA